MAIFQTAASADDAVEDATLNSVSITADGTDTAHEISSSNHVGFRFPNVTFAQGTVITNAYLYFDELANFTGVGTISNVTLYGENADSAASFTTAASNISGRARTTASATGLSDSGTAWESPNGRNVTTIVQEILNRAGWVSGNAMAMLFIGTGAAAAGFICPYHWDYFTGTYRARLEINRPAAVRAKPRKMMQAVHRASFV